MTTTIVDAHGWWFLIRVAVARWVGFQRSAMAHRAAAADQQRDKQGTHAVIYEIAR